MEKYTYKQIQPPDEKQFKYNESYSDNTDDQGIPWKLVLQNSNREQYRLSRLESFWSYTSNLSLIEIQNIKIQQQKRVKKNEYYRYNKFLQNNLPIFNHFQLRNNLCVTSPYDIYFLGENSIIHRCNLTNTYNQISVTKYKPTSLYIYQDYLGFSDSMGYLVIFNLKKQKCVLNILAADEINTINNHITIYNDITKGTVFASVSNDKKIRFYNEFGSQISVINTNQPVNHIVASPNSQLLLACSDSKNVNIYDLRTEDIAMKFVGHQDDCFVGEWHPNQINFATGSQDLTCRVWDIRKENNTVHTLGANIAAIANIKFSKDGKFIIFGERLDYINIANFEKNCTETQRIDFFGEVAGLDISPDSSNANLFFSVVIRKYGGIFEYQRNLNNKLANVFI